MIERHPFENFFPSNMQYLIVGSFPGRQSTRAKSAKDRLDDWFYSAPRNQFWPILEAVYRVKLQSRQDKQKLLSDLKIGMADIIQECRRSSNSNADQDLKAIVYNTEGIGKILKKVKKVFFTSRYVEIRFKELFGSSIKGRSDLELICLPSPSPRFARISFDEKVEKYRELLPKFSTIENLF